MQNNIEGINKKEITPFISFEKAWADLKPELDAEAIRREKKKRRIIFFWFTSIIIGLGAGAYIVENSNTKTIVAHKNTTINTGNYQEKTIANKETDATASSKKTENDSKEKLITNIVNSSSNVGSKSNQEQALQQSFVEAKSGKATANFKKNKLLKSANDIAVHSTKIESSNSGNTNYDVNDSKVTTSKISQQKNANDIVKNTAKTIDNNDEIIAQPTVTNSTVAITNSIDSTKKIVDTIVAKAVVKNTPNDKTKKATERKSKTIHYGLQWNLPAQTGVNFLDVNSVNRPATLLIPQLFVSTQLNKKHSLVFAFNPYSQYYLNNKAVVDFTKYNVIIYSGTQSNTTKPEEIIYTETTAFNKLISIEASLLYQYQISSKVKIGFGIGNSWVQGALMQNKVVKNSSLITRDSLYGIDKTDKDWSHLKNAFLVGKFEAQYNIKKLDIGVCFSKPISSPFSNNQYKTPINTSLFIKWAIK